MTLFWYAFLFISFVIAMNDWLTFKIPNKLLLIIVGLYCLRNLCFFTPSSLMEPSIYATITLVIGFVFYTFRIAGAGDAKFMAASVLWMSDFQLFKFCFYVGLIGGIMAIVYMVFKDHLAAVRIKTLSLFQPLKDQHYLKRIFLERKTEDSMDQVMETHIQNGKVLPYGVAIFLASLIIVIQNSAG